MRFMNYTYIHIHVSVSLPLFSIIIVTYYIKLTSDLIVYNKVNLFNNTLERFTPVWHWQTQANLVMPFLKKLPKKNW